MQEGGVGQQFAALGREDGDAAFEVEEVEGQAFALHGNDFVAILQLAILLEDGATDVSQFRLREVYVVVVNEAAVGRFNKLTQTRDGLAESVGEVEQEHNDNGEEQEHEYGEDILGAHIVAHVFIVGQGHAHLEVAIVFGEVEVGPLGRFALPHVITLARLPCLAHLGARVVVGWREEGQTIRFIDHLSRSCDDGGAHFGRGHKRRVATSAMLHGHDVGVAAQAGRHELLAIDHFAVVLENHQHHGKYDKYCREVQQKFRTIFHGRRGF